MKIDGNKLRKIREQKGISRAELQEKTGVSSRTILSWESGERQPRGETVADFNKLLDFFDIPIEILYEDAYIERMKIVFGMISDDELEAEELNRIEKVREIWGLKSDES